MTEVPVAEEFALARDFAIIMVVAGLAVVVFRRLKQPSILGYLLAGLLVGPFTFPNPPVTNIESIRLLADLGLVLLLFAVGLEFGWRRIRQVGLGVLVIATIEMLIMISLGYQTGRFLGWTSMESLFLGSALSITSSAILIKVLRDTDRLGTAEGRLVVGISAVEDFVGVILLTLLPGIATTGAAGLGDIGPLVAKLAIFSVASLMLGALFVPRIIRFVAQLQSTETMLLASLALCFALALIGQSLGISAAAGAFLIGAVVGDTDESERVARIIAPIRDMFGALFFVSIGMLIDVFTIKDYLFPALVITIVFIVGKVLGNTVGTFTTGRPGRTPIQVGMSMPQIGEFSLAIVKVGVEYQAIGAFVYQVVAGVTVVNSLVYPYVARSADWVADFLDRVSPTLVKRYVSYLSMGLGAFRAGLSLDSEFSQRVRGSFIVILINFMIIVVLVALGTLASGFAPDISELIGLKQGIVGSAIGFAILALCFPSALAIWRGVHQLADDTTTHLIVRTGPSREWVQETLRNVIGDSVTIFLLVLIGLWSIPFVAELLSLGYLAVPVPLLILTVLVFIAIRVLTRIHGQLVRTFRRTFLGGPGRPAQRLAVAAAVEAGRPGEDRGRAQAPPRGDDRTPSEPESIGSGPPDAGDIKERVSLGEAEIIALSTVSRDRAPYRRRMGRKQVIWDIKDAEESRDYYRITLNFRTPEAAATDVGEEELYIDRYGEVRIRQIRSWPLSGGTW